MIRPPPISTRTEHSFPTRRSSDLSSLSDQIAKFLSELLDICLRRFGEDSTILVFAHMKSKKIKSLFNRCNLCLLCRRSEEHTSELQSLMRISYAVFCLKKKKRSK